MLSVGSLQILREGERASCEESIDLTVAIVAGLVSEVPPPPMFIDELACVNTFRGKFKLLAMIPLRLLFNFLTGNFP